MKIETKFNIGDLTEKKYDSYHETKVVCEIIEIVPVTCIAGTQVFYNVRFIICREKVSFSRDKTEPIWEIERGHSKENGQNPYHRYREDELIPITDFTRKIMKL